MPSEMVTPRVDSPEWVALVEILKLQFGGVPLFVIELKGTKVKFDEVKLKFEQLRPGSMSETLTVTVFKIPAVVD